MNILSTIPTLDAPAEVELTDDEIEAQEKSWRIDYHREKVRNGPVKFSFMTNGQVRRAEKRARKSQRDKIWRKQKRSHFENQRIAAFLRPHLQNVGLIEYLDGRSVSMHDQIVSTAWIAQRFGVEVKTLDNAGTGRVSFRSDDLITALEQACAYLENITGERVEVSEDFTPAIYSEA